MTSVLLIEDDAGLRRALRTSLTARDLEVVEAASGADGVLAVADGRADIVLLDLGLPDIDGFEVLERIRSFSELPVIVLSAREHRDDKVRALDAGADDYVPKPFDTEELLARIRAALRRRPGQGVDTASTIRCGDLEIDLARRLVHRGGQRVALTRTEMALLEELATNPDRLLTHDLLLRRVWGPGYSTEKGYLRTYVGQLRKKLGDDAGAPRLIVTESGVGYRWIGEMEDSGRQEG